MLSNQNLSKYTPELIVLLDNFIKESLKQLENYQKEIDYFIQEAVDLDNIKNPEDLVEILDNIGEKLKNAQTLMIEKMYQNYQTSISPFQDIAWQAQRLTKNLNRSDEVYRESQIIIEIYNKLMNLDTKEEFITSSICSTKVDSNISQFSEAILNLNTISNLGNYFDRDLPLNTDLIMHARKNISTETAHIFSEIKNNLLLATNSLKSSLGLIDPVNKLDELNIEQKIAYVNKNSMKLFFGTVSKKVVEKSGKYWKNLKNIKPYIKNTKLFAYDAEKYSYYLLCMCLIGSLYPLTAYSIKHSASENIPNFVSKVEVVSEKYDKFKSFCSVKDLDNGFCGDVLDTILTAGKNLSLNYSRSSMMDFMDIDYSKFPDNPEFLTQAINAVLIQNEKDLVLADEKPKSIFRNVFRANDFERT